MQFIDAVKCFHSLACSLMVSVFLSLAIQATIGFSSNVCGPDNELETGDEKCEYNDQRTWALIIFYGSAVVFLIGMIGTSQSNGWIIITYITSFVIFVGVIVGLVVYRMSSESLNLTESVNTVTREVIRDKWGLYSDILRWIVLIGPITAFSFGCYLVLHFLKNNYL